MTASEKQSEQRPREQFSLFLRAVWPELGKERQGHYVQIDSFFGESCAKVGDESKLMN